jgi:hypothetical protein
MRQMYTLEELARELERQSEVKEDYLTDTRRIHFTSTSEQSEIDLLGEGGGEPAATGLVLNDIAHSQLATWLKIPLNFYRRLQGDLPELLDQNVNRLLRHAPATRMIRTMDGTARAFLSDSYRRLDNDEIARNILPVLGEIPDLSIRSCAVTDTRMHIKATTPRLRGNVVGQEVCAGVYIGNSEVGFGRVVVYPFVEVLICTNGMVVQRAGEGMMRQVHVGRRVEADNMGRVFRPETVAADDHAFMMALSDVVRAAVDEVRFRELLRDMERTTSTEPIADPVAAVRVLSQRESLSEDESRDVLRHLATGGDLSLWGLLNAVTRTAEDSATYDRATELETLGGKMMDYTGRDWRPVARAREGDLVAA